MLRRSIILAGLLAALLTFSAVPVFAAPPANNNLSALLTLHAPASGTIISIHEATLEAGEPTASCAVDGNDANSVWFRVSAPAGKLTIATTTVEAGYDTVITLYELPRINSIANLGPELACAVNPGEAATLIKKVSGERYLVRIASDNSAALAAGTLNYSVTFTPPKASLVPASDSRFSAAPVVFNKSSKIKNLQYATRDGSDPLPACAAVAPLDSVWFTFAGTASQVTVSAEGSTLGYEPDAYGGVAELAVYSGSPGSMSAIGCDDSSGLHGAGRMTFTANSGVDYFVMIYHDNSAHEITQPSTARLLVVPASVKVGTNTNFDAGLTGWTISSASGDGIASDAGTPNDNNAFRFTGGPNEKSQLKQKIKFPANLFVPAETVLRMNYGAESQTLVTPLNSLTLEITFAYADGKTVKLKQPLIVPATVSSPITVGYTFPIFRKSPVSMTVAIKNKSSGGDVAIDDFNFNIEATSAARQMPSGLLTLPPAPGR